MKCPGEDHMKKKPILKEQMDKSTISVRKFKIFLKKKLNKKKKKIN